MSKKCTSLRRDAHFQVNISKKLTVLDGFWKIRCRNSARCCGAKPISNSKCTKHTPFSNHFCKFRCSRIARRCGAKHISKSTCKKHASLGPLLEVRMPRNCTQWWREAKHISKHVSGHFWRDRCRKTLDR